MQSGTVLDGRYRLIEPVGAGGFGQVWRAHDPRVDRLVAVKVLTSDGSTDHDRQVARFAREAAVAGGLSHPHIVTVHDFGAAKHDGRPYAYLVMRLLHGKSLSAILEAGPLPLPTALYAASCVADALDAAHQAGLTHRDIKPSNIMVRDDGEATVVDFGITKGADARHDITTTGVLFGTPAYMAPEALSGTFDHRSDLYSLGCVLFEAVTGRRPFTGTAWQLINQHLNESPALLRTLRPDAPVELERLVGRLLAKDPARRPDSADEVYNLLEDINARCFGDTSPIPSRGDDTTSMTYISRNEAAAGTIAYLYLSFRENCRDCAPVGNETRVLTCTTCKGSGTVISDIRTLRIRIPAGIRDGQKLRIRERGSPGKHGGPPGDHYVTVHVIA
ncbi:protein kinase [Streptomyces sp. NPDC101175]|uniref:protein kinase domain-containing protein n=1 Tax=Streptomyces sp. NPDC101175 TaxID=3366123 RepID=UPI003834C949